MVLQDCKSLISVGLGEYVFTKRKCPGSGIQLRNDYCVSIPNYVPTYSTRAVSSSAAFTNPLGTWWGPAPTQTL
jgi:hypothetical protein